MAEGNGSSECKADDRAPARAAAKEAFGRLLLLATLAGLVPLGAATCKAAPRLELLDPGEPPRFAAAGQRKSRDFERQLEFGGRQRRYEVHVPAAYDGQKSMPLVLNYHGGGGNARAARRGTHMDEKSDEAGFLVLYPDGTGRFQKRLLTFNGGLCCGYAATHQIDDVGFTEAILTDAAQFFQVDQKRIYATGLSNGAIMSYRVACELSHRIAAIAPVSGPMEFVRCRPERPVPVMHIHGTADQNAPYEGGTGSHSITRTAFRSVKQTISRWLDVDNCGSKPSSVQTSGTVRIERWTPRPGGAEVVLVTIEGGGHCWPGGDPLLPRFIVGQDVSGIKANDLIWEFFSRHRLP